ncbi:MAG: CBS domain-containing protein [Candidatus Firestonebacteria bacterium]|nr:CBS domain-containing protein [Candidatus Firestonebacteria bacterium]
MNESIFVIGHKSPDTDSICAAICYARFKKAKGEANVIAARAGSINHQTEFVLNYFNVQAPLFLSDVVPKVNQAMTKKVISCNKETSLKDLIKTMEEKNVRLIPILVRLSIPSYKVAQNYDGYLSQDKYLLDIRVKILNAYNRGLVVLNDDKQLI